MLTWFFFAVMYTISYKFNELPLFTVAKACTMSSIQGTTVYYDASLYQNGDCFCEFNTTSRTIQIAPVVQPPIDTCGSKVSIDIGPENPFFGQQESISCYTGNVNLDTSIYTSGRIAIQNDGGENNNPEFCLKFESDIGTISLQ